MNIIFLGFLQIWDKSIFRVNKHSDSLVFLGVIGSNNFNSCENAFSRNVSWAKKRAAVNVLMNLLPLINNAPMSFKICQSSTLKLCKTRAMTNLLNAIEEQSLPNGRPWYKRQFSSIPSIFGFNISGSRKVSSFFEVNRPSDVSEGTFSTSFVASLFHFCKANYVERGILESWLQFSETWG